VHLQAGHTDKQDLVLKSGQAKQLADAIAQKAHTELSGALTGMTLMVHVVLSIRNTFSFGRELVFAGTVFSEIMLADICSYHVRDMFAKVSAKPCAN